MADDLRVGHVSQPWHAAGQARHLLGVGRRRMLSFDWQRLRDPWLIVPVAVATTIAMAGSILAPGNMSIGLAIVGGLLFVVVAFKNPYVGLAIFLPSIALIPWETQIRGGLWLPEPIRLVAPTLLCAALFRALSARFTPKFRITVVDALACALGLSGLLGLVVHDILPSGKLYGKAMLFPLFFYFIARFVEWDRSRFRRFLGIQLAATALCALLMVVQSITGRSLLYRGGTAAMTGVHLALGPFKWNFVAASFLCLWPPLFFYAATTASKSWTRASWLAGAGVTIMALMYTQQRAMIAGAAIGLLVCLLARDLRRTVLLTGCVALLGATPALLLGIGPTWLIERFDEEQSYHTRAAYNAGAIGILKSSDWNPLFGVGYYRYGLYAGQHTPPELLERAFQQPVERLFARGYTPRPHNTPLCLLVEMGALHTGLFVAVLLGIGYHWLQCFRQPCRADVALLVALLAMTIGVLFSGWFHNLYVIAQATVYLWFFAGLVVGHKHLFRLPAGEAAGNADRAPALPANAPVGWRE